jgi:hypothetical protein
MDLDTAAPGCRHRHALLVFAAAGLLAAAAPGTLLAGDDWPPISKEELALKDNPASFGAHAMILYQEQHIDDTKSFETCYFRIKIFTEGGKKYANIEIPYVEKKIEVQDIRGRTVRPDGTVVEFHGEVFDRVVARAKKLKFQAKTFTLPGVQAGSIIEYSYRLQWHQSIPDVVKNPEKYIIQGNFSLATAHWTIQQDIFTRRARFSIRPVPNAHLGWTWSSLSQKNGPVAQADGTVQLEVEGIPAFQEEEYMPPEDVLRSRLDFFYIVGYMPSPESFWSEQGRRRAEEIEKFIGKRKGIEQAAAAIVGANDSPETKLRKLYTRVQQIRNLSHEHRRTKKEEEREDLRTNENVENVLRRGYARGNEINYLFVALARGAGFPAYVVEVTARDRALFRRNLLDSSQLNAMVVAVGSPGAPGAAAGKGHEASSLVGSQVRYLDPATPFCPFGLLPWAESGTEGIELEGYNRIVRIPKPHSADAVIKRKAELQLDETGSLSGTLQVSFLGQEALQRRLGAVDRDATSRRKDLEDEVKAWLPAGAAVELGTVVGWESAEEPLRADFRLRIPQAAVPTGRRLLLPVSVFQMNKEYHFLHGNRVHPIYFTYPFQQVDDVTVRLPSGYQIEFLPGPQETTRSFAQYEISAERQSAAVRLQRRMVLENYTYPATEYPAVRRFFSTVRAGDEGTAVLQIVQAVQK